MDQLYLKIHSKMAPYSAPIETSIVLYIVSYTNAPISVNFVLDLSKTDRSFSLDLTSFPSPSFYHPSELPHSSKLCELPNIVEYDNSATIAGLCAILRRIVKLSPDFLDKGLLGFKDSCLLACSEVSVWTRFCEVDVIKTLKTQCATSQTLPETLARFERHLEQPVRLHNIKKYTKSKSGMKMEMSRDEEGNPDHSYAEGSTLTISDLIIFVCVYKLVTEIMPMRILQQFPLLKKWYERLMDCDGIVRALETVFPGTKRCETVEEYVVPEVERKSLYRSDQKKYKPRNKIFTRQDEVESSLDLIKNHDLEIDLEPFPFGFEETIERDSIPYEATPEGGALPPERLERKFQQLENLAKPILKLARPGDVVVDFCSGSGHLGILIACLLPDCKIILLENKEESLKIARERVRKMALHNVHFCQSNLDYFTGRFDIGTSLHACGVATDLVIRHCIDRGAIFVCCPCCYGSIQDCHHITYPRSEIFQNVIDKRSYLVLGHAADQTHDEENKKTKQGYECMAVIDTDRKLHAAQFGYSVHLAKLAPSTCTPKNNLLVGVPLSRQAEF